jgi:hypothetical protein
VAVSSPTDLAASPRRPNQTSPDVTRLKQREFLKALAQSGNKLDASRQVGISDTMPYAWARKSASFAERMAEAQARGDALVLAKLEQELHRRALSGPKDQQSALLLMFSTKKLDPRYRDNAQVTLNAQGPVAISLGLEAGEGPQPLVVPASSAKLTSGQPE